MLLNKRHQGTDDKHHQYCLLVHACTMCGTTRYSTDLQARDSGKCSSAARAGIELVAHLIATDSAWPRWTSCCSLPILLTLKAQLSNDDLHPLLSLSLYLESMNALPYRISLLSKTTPTALRSCKSGFCDPAVFRETSFLKRSSLFLRCRMNSHTAKPAQEDWSSLLLRKQNCACQQPAMDS